MDKGKKTMHVGIHKGDIAPYVFLTGSPERSAKIASYFDQPQEVAYNREYRSFNGHLDGTPVTVCSVGMGGPSFAIGMEELTECGGAVFLRVGTCDSVCDRVKRGMLVIPNGAVRLEGVANHYSPVEYPAVPDMDLVRILEAAALKTGYPFEIGVDISRSYFGTGIGSGKPGWSGMTDKWKACLDGGALCTDLDSAVLFVTADCLKVRAAEVLLCKSDNGHYGIFSDSDPEELEYRSIETALEAMKTVIERDRKN